MVQSGVAAHQRTVLGGVPVLAVGLPLTDRDSRPPRRVDAVRVASDEEVAVESVDVILDGWCIPYQARAFTRDPAPQSRSVGSASHLGHRRRVTSLEEQARPSVLLEPPAAAPSGTAISGRHGPVADIRPCLSPARWRAQAGAGPGRPRTHIRAWRVSPPGARAADRAGRAAATRRRRDPPAPRPAPLSTPAAPRQPA